MASEIHQDDIGTRFSITVKDDGNLVNISGVDGGSVHQVSFRKPSDKQICKPKGLWNFRSNVL